MKRVKLIGGPLEMEIQRELVKLGLRFERNCKRLGGSPDIVFVKEKIAIFVDGDFWHGWRLPKWDHKLPEFWRQKLHANRKRDARNFRRLRAANWRVIRIWEHEIRKDKKKCVERILGALSIEKRFMGNGEKQSGRSEDSSKKVQ